MSRVVRLTGGPAGMQAALPWPADTEWPDVLWAAPAEHTETGERVILFAPECAPGLHRYRKVRQSNLSDGQAVGIVRGAEYQYAPVSAPHDADREAAGEYGPTPEDAP